MMCDLKKLPQMFKRKYRSVQLKVLLFLPNYLAEVKGIRIELYARTEKQIIAPFKINDLSFENLKEFHECRILFVLTF